MLTKVGRSDHDDVYASGDAPQSLVDRERSGPTLHTFLHDQKIQVAVGAHFASRCRPEENDPLGVGRFDHSVDDLRQESLVRGTVMSFHPRFKYTRFIHEGCGWALHSLPRTTPRAS